MRFSICCSEQSTGSVCTCQYSHGNCALALWQRVDEAIRATTAATMLRFEISINGYPPTVTKDSHRCCLCSQIARRRVRWVVPARLALKAYERLVYTDERLLVVSDVMAPSLSLTSLRA